MLPVREPDREVEELEPGFQPGPKAAVNVDGSGEKDPS